MRRDRITNDNKNNEIFLLAFSNVSDVFHQRLFNDQIKIIVLLERNTLKGIFLFTV